MHRARVALAEETVELADEIATAVQDRVLALAAWRTVPQLRRAVRRATAVVDPVIAEVAHAAAVERRTVERWSDRDRMAALTAWLPAPEADFVFTALDAGAAPAEHPGELAGYGPIPASMARSLAADGNWRQLVTDPVGGALLDHGRRRHHRLKTFGGWTLALGADASVIWTSPAGVTYTLPAPRIGPDG